MLAQLDREGVTGSTAAACSDGREHPSTRLGVHPRASPSCTLHADSGPPLHLIVRNVFWELKSECKVQEKAWFKLSACPPCASYHCPPWNREGAWRGLTLLVLSIPGTVERTQFGLMLCAALTWCKTLLLSCPCDLWPDPVWWHDSPSYGASARVH